MHVATDVQAEMFTITSCGQQVPLSSALPRWTEADRLGVVVDEPYGGLGASLLMQLAALRHYEVAPARRGPDHQYPSTCVFHIDQYHGDHSSFDVWPRRHDVLVKDGPQQLLCELVDRRITRLLVPNPAGIPTGDHASAMPSGWSDLNAALETITESLVYTASGTRVDNAEDSLEFFHVSSKAQELERMSLWSLAPEETYALYSPMDDETLVETMKIGPSSAGDLRQWLATVRQRIDETPSALREALTRRRLESLVAGVRTQTFQRVSTRDVLGITGRPTAT